MTISSFEALPLAEPLQRALRAAGYDTPSPIQAQAIPLLLEGRDVLGSAQTGTGKTAAFALPILHHLYTNPRPLEPYKPRALILTPTRELALQISENFTKYGAFMQFRMALIYGGVSQHPQTKLMARGVDILVATPGRLLDLFGQNALDLDTVEFFVLDEVDQMLDMGFINDIRKVLAEVPAKRQSLFFSATMAKPLEDLASKILTNPARIAIAPESMTADNVEQQLCLVSAKQKENLLADLIETQLDSPGERKILVFTRTKHGANKLAEKLSKRRLPADAIHGNKSQAARQRALDNFRTGRIRTLVATDVAARGIDVKNITLVVNYDLPEEAEAYVHRIGRTARAGESGLAISFCASDELGYIPPIERRIKRTIPLQTAHPYHADELEKAYANRNNIPKPSPQRGGGGGGRGQRGPSHAGPPVKGGRGGRPRRAGHSSAPHSAGAHQGNSSHGHAAPRPHKRNRAR